MRTRPDFTFTWPPTACFSAAASGCRPTRSWAAFAMPSSTTRVPGRASATPEVQDAGGIQGDALKRPPRGFDPEHAHIEDLKRKSFYVMAEAAAGTP